MSKVTKAFERSKEIILKERKVNQKVKLGYKDESYMTEEEMIKKSKNFRLSNKLYK